MQASEIEIGKRPFMFFARVKVKEDSLQEYLKLSETVVNKISDAHSGILYQTLNQSLTNSLNFNWSDIYADDEAFNTLGNSTLLQEYIRDQMPFIEGMTVDVYGSLKQETKDFMLSFGFPIEFHELTPVGFFRPTLQIKQNTESKHQLATSKDGLLNESHPFLLVARINAKENKKEEYLKLCKEVDDGVNSEEPEMLFHTVNQHPDKSNQIAWAELYQNEQAFFAHQKNPFVIDHAKKQADLHAGWRIEIYGNVSQTMKDTVQSFGHETEFYEIKFGYCRNNCLQTSPKISNEDMKKSAPKNVPQKTAWFSNLCSCFNREKLNTEPETETTQPEMPKKAEEEPKK